MATSEDIHYFAIDDSWWERIARDWSEKSIQHLHFSDSFTIIAAYQEQIIGIISTYWRGLPIPVADTVEGYIDFLEVKPVHRRRGIATQLIALTVEQARKQKAYQVRAWSSEDKIEAIPLWRQLGFSLCPATTYPQGQEVRGFFVTKVLC